MSRLIRKQPTLLILDGVEPLQSPETTDHAGQVRDPGLQALIIELASWSSGFSLPAGTSQAKACTPTGLTVISTRARPSFLIHSTISPPTQARHC